MNRRSIIAANWKINGSSTLVKAMTTAISALNVSDNVEVVLNLPATFLSLAQQSAKAGHLSIGAQNVSEHASGAYTGEISTSMLKEFSVKYVIVGHSERRSLFKESSHCVAEKVAKALEADLTPILCIGESENERVTGETDVILASQLQPVIDLVGIDKFENVVVAYEPVWAIGSGKTASPEMAQETHAFIRQFLAASSAEVANKVPLLYGGSMNADNCKILLEQQDIDGGLIGGASLKVADFSKICLSA